MAVDVTRFLAVMTMTIAVIIRIHHVQHSFHRVETRDRIVVFL